MAIYASRKLSLFRIVWSSAPACRHLHAPGRALDDCCRKSARGLRATLVSGSIELPPHSMPKTIIFAGSRSTTHKTLLITSKEPIEKIVLGLVGMAMEATCNPYQPLQLRDTLWFPRVHYRKHFKNPMPRSVHDTCLSQSKKNNNTYNRGHVLLGMSFGFLGHFFWFSVRGYWKKCRSHKHGTNAEAAVVFLGMFFGFVLFVAISKHPPTISSYLAVSIPCLTSRTNSSGQIMGARQSVGLSGFAASGF